ncbi:MAG: hypothetical protein OHK0039_46550 [Bacteroidia bacterium]
MCLAWLAGGQLWAQGSYMDLLDNMKPRSIGPAGMSGRVTAIDGVAGQPDILYVGTASGGLWKTVNGGTTWQPLFDSQRVAGIGALAVFQKNPSIIWAGTGEGNPRNSQTSGYGVYRSLDAGRTWQCMGLEETRVIHRIYIHPDDPNTVWVGAQGSAWNDSRERGVFKTTDGGKTWAKVLYVNERTGIADLVVDPANPNKLLAAMWEFRRQPWFFQSGGPGSGLYMSLDGGETWTRRSHKDGLPEGDLGRIGLAIAPSDPQRVYALVEAKKNALYASQDGGYTWRQVNDKDEIGNRPFYYSDLYVDPVNENRIYSLHSTVTMSEDGGRSFSTLLGYVGSGGIHPDHHAWWIDPQDPTFLVNGNDGGLAISRDRGQSWQFIENLPLAQYYHINYDNEYPYNVYGGMQDNGSWRGPAYVWRAGGIRNSYFEELYFGDGFDVVPDPQNARYGYAMSQGGYLGRYDVQTGFTKFIRPVHPEGTTLRFNWNAGIAQDPFDPAAIYYGSQFVHRSRDRGETWELLSPDLTTNDTSKQQQARSGGLTYDVTAAENHTTIITIAPSPVERGVIWVGTDDGNLQLTRDDGKTWTLLTTRLPGAPRHGWIPQIHPSNHSAAEAYVVLNNYRQGDWQPYLYRTRDYGQTWERLADADKVWGYCLSVVQDPEVAQLLFLGTEYGLYVSIDGGSTWDKWKHGYPTVSTMDMKIHPREGDLIIGTFGRAAYILDDIRPLRALARAGAGLLDRELVVFEAPEAVLAEYAQASGIRFAGDAMFGGQNRQRGAMLSFSVNPAFGQTPPPPPAPAPAKGKGKKPAVPPVVAADSTPAQPAAGKTRTDSVKIEIVDLRGEVIRTLKVKPDTGLNRVYWRLDRKGVDYPSRSGESGGRRFGGGGGEPSGGPVLPGDYTVRMTYRGSVDSTRVRVIFDPRIEAPAAHLQAVLALQQQRLDYVALVTEAANNLRTARETLDKVECLLPKGDAPEVKTLRDDTKAMRDSVERLSLRIFTPENEKGITDDSQTLLSELYAAGNYLDFSSEAPNATQQLVLRQMIDKTRPVVEAVNAFFDGPWKAYQARIDAARLSPFTDIPAVEWKE